MKNNALLYNISQRVSTAWVVLLIAMIATLWGWFIIREVEQQQIKHNIFDYRVEHIKNAITARITAYQQVLQSGVGLFMASQSVRRAEWHAFVTNLQINKYYPGIQGIGFSKVIAPEDKINHINEIRSEGGFLQNYTIKPDYEREQYTAIVYLEPLDKRNQQAIGYDMFSEPTRRNAMERARDTGEAALSGKVTLVQEIDDDVQAGFLIYIPVYRAGSPHQTVAERRAALVGYVYSPFRMRNLIQGIFGEQQSEINLHIYDGNQVDNLNLSDLMYDEIPGFYAKNSYYAPSPLQTTKKLEIAGHTWTLQLTSMPQFAVSTKSYGANIVLFGGIIASILLFGLTRSLETRHLLRVEHQINLKLHEEIKRREKIEQALRESEERFDLAMRGSNDGLWDWNVETNEVYFSPRWKEMLGYRVDEIPHHIDEWQRRIHPDDLKQVMLDVKQYVNQETPLYQNTHRVQHKNGNYVWILDRGMAIRDTDGNPSRVVGTHTDLTQLKQVEEELKRLNRDFVALLENTSDFICFKDREGQIHFCSQNFASLAGYQHWREVIGKYDHEVFPKNVVENYYEKDQSIFLNSNSLRDNLTLYHDFQGNSGWLHTNKCPVFGDDGTTVVGIFGISRDITEHRRMEAELRDAKKLSDDIINSLPGIFYMLDSNGKLVRWNPCFSAVTGYSDIEMAGKSALDVIVEADRASVATRIKEVFEKGESFVEACLLNKKGEATPYYLTGRRTTLQDQTYVVGLGQDIAARKQMERQLWQLANTDFLTGLMNRRHFMNQIEEEFMRVRYHEVSCSCILMLDLDHFKLINDTYNHNVGDTVLKHFAHLVQNSLRQRDIAGRLGGEEFAIMLPCTNIAEAQKCAERLRQLTATTPIIENNNTISLTVSIGTTMLNENDACVDAALIRADNALYGAKKSGRNRIQIAA